MRQLGYLRRRKCASAWGVYSLPHQQASPVPFISGEGEKNPRYRAVVTNHGSSCSGRRKSRVVTKTFPLLVSFYGEADAMLQALVANPCVRLLDRNRQAWSFTFLVLGYLFYLVFGAVVFSSVELPHEDLLRRDLFELKRRFLQENECLSEERLEQFLARVLKGSSYGVSVLNNVSGNWNWDFTSALFFASTVLSTTGYGHTVPLSDGGKTFCIIYSVIGIPFTLLFLTALVELIIVYVTRRPVLYIHSRWGFPKQAVARIHAVILGFITVLFFFFIPAATFSVLEEDWNFLESFYFCFISLSTIGLGDYVPAEGQNQKYRKLYKLGITCYLLIGLTVMLVVLETFCELQELKTIRKMFYRESNKDEEQEDIMQHDQLAFASISDQVSSLREDLKLNEPFVTLQPAPNYFFDSPISHEQKDNM